MNPPADLTNPRLRVRSRLLDLVILMAAFFVVLSLFHHLVLPNVGRTQDILEQGGVDQLQRALAPGGVYAQSLLGYRLSAAVMCIVVLYGLFRVRSNPGVSRIFSLVAVPACAVGMCLSLSQSLSLRLLDRIDRPAVTYLTPSEQDARQMWAALLWTQEQTVSLPPWTRGGHEQWMMPGGGLIKVKIAQDKVEVLHQGLASGLDCKRFEQALVDTRPRSASQAEIVVEGDAFRGCGGPAGARDFSLVLPLAAKS